MGAAQSARLADGGAGSRHPPQAPMPAFASPQDKPPRVAREGASPLPSPPVDATGATLARSIAPTAELPRWASGATAKQTPRAAGTGAAAPPALTASAPASVSAKGIATPHVGEHPRVAAARAAVTPVTSPPAAPKSRAGALLEGTPVHPLAQLAAAAVVELEKGRGVAPAASASSKEMDAVEEGSSSESEQWEERGSVRKQAGAAAARATPTVTPAAAHATALPKLALRLVPPAAAASGGGAKADGADDDDGHSSQRQGTPAPVLPLLEPAASTEVVPPPATAPAILPWRAGVPLLCPFQVISDIALDAAVASASHPNVHVRRAVQVTLSDFLGRASAAVPSTTFAVRRTPGKPPATIRLGLEVSRELPSKLALALQWATSSSAALDAVTRELEATTAALEGRTSSAIRTMPVRSRTPARSPKPFFTQAAVGRTPTPLQEAPVNLVSAAQSEPAKKQLRWREPIVTSPAGCARRASAPGVAAGAGRFSLKRPYRAVAPSYSSLSAPEPEAPVSFEANTSADDAWSLAMGDECNVTRRYRRGGCGGSKSSHSSRMKRRRLSPGENSDDDEATQG